MRGEHKEVEEFKFNAQEMMDFEARLQFLSRRNALKAREQGIKNPPPVYMEVSPEFLSQLNNGTIPSCKYVIWHNVRVCLPDSAKDIAKEEGKTIHEVVFKNEAGYRLVTVLNK